MEFKNDIHLQPPDKEKLIHSVQILKEKMLENEKKMMDILKDSSCYNNPQLLEYQINILFKTGCKLEDYQKILNEFESNEDDENNTDELVSSLMEFILSVSNGKHCSETKALIVVPSESIGSVYMELIRRLALENVIITTWRAMTTGDVQENLENVKIALLDGSDEVYYNVFGSQSIRFVIENYVGNRLYLIRGNKHRIACFKHVLEFVAQ